MIINSQTSKSWKDYFNLDRADSGWLRLLIVILFIILSFLAIRYGYLLTIQGLKGEFSILAEFKGLKLYVTSLVPGLFFVIAAIIGLVWGLPKTLKALINQ